MKNRIKIVYNTNQKLAKYLFNNDRGDWVDVHESSVLSRKEYLEAIGNNEIEKVMNAIIDEYSMDDDGVSIIFSGNQKVFKSIKKVINEQYKDKNIDFSIVKQTKCIILGKQGVGKTFLIEAIFSSLGRNIKPDKKTDYWQYIDASDGIELYEIRGIEMGMKTLDPVINAIKECIDEGANRIIYCFSAAGAKIDDFEIRLFKALDTLTPDIEITVAITNAIDNLAVAKFKTIISSTIGERHIIPVLAKDKGTRIGLIHSFGVEDIIKNINGGVHIIE